jgi:hypothetical protein
MPRRSQVSRLISKYEGEVHVPIVDGIRSTITMRRAVKNSGMTQNMPVRVNYGMIRVMQSVFMASNKMSFTATPTHRYTSTPASRSSHGGSKSLGEMELLQLYGAGLKHTLQELKDRADSCIIQCLC